MHYVIVLVFQIRSPRRGGNGLAHGTPLSRATVHCALELALGPQSEPSQLVDHAINDGCREEHPGANVHASPLRHVSHDMMRIFLRLRARLRTASGEVGKLVRPGKVRVGGVDQDGAAR